MTPAVDRASVTRPKRGDVPQTGVTVRAHVASLLTEAALVIDRTRGLIHPLRRLRPGEREQLRRELAGVIATCETVRIWLDKGAPH